MRAAARLSTVVAGAENVRAGTSTPRPPTPSVPLTKLLGRQGLTRALLLLALATAKASLLYSTTPTSTTAAATPTAAATAATSTPTAAASVASTSTTATEAPPPATTPTSTPTPSTATTATTAAPAIPSSTLAPLAPAAAAPPTRSRRSADRLEANEVDSSSRGIRRQKGNGGAPLKEKGTRVATRGSYIDYTLFSCKEALLEEVNGERGGAKGEEVTAGDYGQLDEQQHRVWSNVSELYCQHRQQGQQRRQTCGRTVRLRL
ncbi:unnamed protein product [Closterium sp. NIES-54]